MPKAKAGAAKAKPEAKKSAAKAVPTKPGKGAAKKAAAKAEKPTPTKVPGPAPSAKAPGPAPSAKAPAAPKKAAAPEKAAPAAKTAAVAKPVEKAVAAAKPAAVAKTAKAARATPAPAVGAQKAKAESVKPAVPVVEKHKKPVAERIRPRATKLPPPGEPLTKREMEQLLTAGQGRGVAGEGSLKGRLVLKEELPHLVVLGRDKRELVFLLQGPDQEVLPAYVDHRVSVSGLIRKTSNYSGSVDVRKYSAKATESEAAEVAPAPVEQKLRYLSPGEVSMVTTSAQGAGIRGFASIRGQLEMTGDEYILVVANAGTRQQVTFTLEGKGAKGLRKMLGQTVQVTGVVSKASGWGGKIHAESVEPRPAEFRPVSREGMEVLEAAESREPPILEMRLGQGLSVRVAEKPGFTWAIEPTAAKRAGLREVRFEPVSGGPGNREFYFTPRNLGAVEVEFFLAKVHAPAQVERSFKLNLAVRP
ncbi:MAG: protease inhibitor I42 family protein [Myxococcaceae bacterium]|nr:protease inhibitor I42 family protein [Myxococcaceae bacterium]